MATNYPVHLHDEDRDFSARWASSQLLAGLVILAAILFIVTAWPETRASEAAWKRHVVASCRSSDCLSPMQVITPDRAVGMKRELGSRLLVVDIGAQGELHQDAPRVRIDAYVPFTEAGSNDTARSGLAFRTAFASDMDELLRSAQVRHNEPVVLLSPSMERSMLAALLLQEHGYSYVFVMNS